MTSFVINGADSTAETLASSETGFVGQNGALWVSATDAIVGTGAVRVNVLGTVSSGFGDGIDVGSGATVTLFVGATGYVGSLSGNAVEVAGTRLDLRNDGTLQATVDAVQFVGLGASASALITNSGTMQGQVYVALPTGEFDLVNSGEITGPDRAVEFTGVGLATIRNSGIIATSDDYAIYGSSGQLSFSNSGEIWGDIWLQLPSTANFIYGNSFVNSGLVVGNILCDVGRDTIDLRGGIVTGEVSGGFYADKYIVDSESIRIVEDNEDGLLDTVEAWCSFDLPVLVEVLVLRGANAVIGRGNILDERLFGSVADNILFGGDGNDLLDGRSGDDVLRGNRGDDTLNAGSPGNDTLVGGQGVDMAVFNDTYDDALVVNLGTGTATGPEGAVWTLMSIEMLRGSEGRDTVTGSSEGDHLDGWFGDDRISGGGGVDTLVGNLGADSLTGGAQNDVFVFASVDHSETGLGLRDIITDFKLAEVIDLGLIDAVSGGSDSAFTFVGTNSLTGGPGRLRFEQFVAENLTLIEGDTTGDGVADFQIELTGLIALTAANFVL